jgi:hypothetical protein
MPVLVLLKWGLRGREVLSMSPDGPGAVPAQWAPQLWQGSLKSQEHWNSPPQGKNRCQGIGGQVTAGVLCRCRQQRNARDRVRLVIRPHSGIPSRAPRAWQGTAVTE